MGTFLSTHTLCTVEYALYVGYIMIRYTCHKLPCSPAFATFLAHRTWPPTMRHYCLTCFTCAESLATMNADLLLPFVWSPSPVIDIVGGGVGPKLGSNMA